MEKRPSSKQPNRPPQYGAFEDLTKKLLAVPKAALDKKMAKYEANKKRKKAGGS